jgi:uncharacterized membrane protein
MDTINKRFKSIAIGYACFAIMWIAVLGFILKIMGWTGLKMALKEPVLILSTMKSTIIYIFAMILINGFMTISIWKALHMSKKKKRFLVFFSFIFASVYAAGLLFSLWQWSKMQTPNWFTPRYNVIPLTMLTIAYGYFAFTLKRAISFSNKSLQPTANSGG